MRTQNSVTYEPRTGHSPDTESAGTLILDFPASRAVRNKYCFSHSVSGIFVIAARTDWVGRLSNLLKYQKTEVKVPGPGIRDSGCLQLHTHSGLPGMPVSYLSHGDSRTSRFTLVLSGEDISVFNIEFTCPTRAKRDTLGRPLSWRKYKQGF